MPACFGLLPNRGSPGAPIRGSIEDFIKTRRFVELRRFFHGNRFDCSAVLPIIFFMKTNFIKFKLSSALLAAAALCFAAYVIPSEAILKQAASVWKNRPEKIYTAKSLVVDGSPDKIKDARSAEFAFDGKGSVKVSLKGEGAGKDAAAKLIYKYFNSLFDDTLAIQFLHGHEIDLKVRGLARWEGEPCFVIGALEGDAKAPQAWFNKEKSHPVKLILGREPKERVEIRFLDWDDPLTKGYFPAKIEVYKGGKLAELFAVE